MNSPEVYGTVFALGPGKTDVNVCGPAPTTADPRDATAARAGRTSHRRTCRSAASASSTLEVRRRLGLRRGQAALNDRASSSRTASASRGRIVTGINAVDCVHAVRGSPARPALPPREKNLCVVRRRDHWESLSLNLPSTRSRTSRSRRIRSRSRRPRLRPRRHQRRCTDVLKITTTRFSSDPPTRSAAPAAPVMLLRKPIEKLTIEVLDSRANRADVPRGPEARADARARPWNEQAPPPQAQPRPAQRRPVPPSRRCRPRPAGRG